MTVSLSPLFNGYQILNHSGLPNSGGKIYTYLAGTSTPQATYTDHTGGIANANPIVLDAGGYTPNEIWLTDGISYKFVVEDDLGSVLETYDNITAPLYGGSLSASTGATLVGTADGGTVQSDLNARPTSAILAASGGASLVGTADGSTLQSLLTNSLDHVVVSIAALRAVSKLDYTEVFVTGYYSSGDGGGGPYYYDAADTTSADNGGTIIVAADGGRWKRVIDSPFIDVEVFGAKGDWNDTTKTGTSNTTFFQNALNAGATQKFSVVANKSATGYLIDGQVTIPNNTQLIGSFALISTNKQYNTTWMPTGGPLLVLTSTTTSPFTCATNSGSINNGYFGGFVIYHPNQTNTNPPVAYPPVFSWTAAVSLTNFTLDNFYLLNCYKFADITGPNSTCAARNIYGFCLNMGIDIDQSLGTFTAEKITFTYGANTYTTSDPIVVYTQANFAGIRTARADNFVFNYINGFVGQRLLWFISSASGTAYGQISNTYCDTFNFAFAIDAIKSFVATNTQIAGTLQGGYGVYVGVGVTTGGSLKFAGFEATGLGVPIFNAGNMTIHVSNYSLGWGDFTGQSAVSVAPTGTNTARVNLIGGDITTNGGTAGTPGLAVTTATGTVGAINVGGPTLFKGNPTVPTGFTFTGGTGTGRIYFDSNIGATGYA